jgi:hypothetical protein
MIQQFSTALTGKVTLFTDSDASSSQSFRSTFWLPNRRDGPHGKTMIRCTRRWNDIQCAYRTRFTSNPPEHQCRFPPPFREDQSDAQQTLFRWAERSIDQRFQYAGASLVATTGASLRIVDEASLPRLLNILLQLGRDFPALYFGQDGLPLSSYRTRKAMVEAGNKVPTEVRTRFAERPSISTPKATHGALSCQE